MMLGYVDEPYNFREIFKQLDQMLYKSKKLWHQFVFGFDQTHFYLGGLKYICQINNWDHVFDNLMEVLTSLPLNIKQA